MTDPLLANRVLRLASGVLLLVGLVAHLVLGTMAGLGLAAVGLVLHVLAAVYGRRWLRRRRR